ncbi:hypothetical protein FA13DRAFT_1818863 [Coprinellus micaceus]|uniref:Uncharacterized protein n=1 Tax=Coprinellus micaceus TaxID=71717 RepID=A0A4Y7SLG9_COPMI|nr:hypothetical protein FA13DRAFT_1818863 [Coprinellus micaceus]
MSGNPEIGQAPATGSRVVYFANAQNNHFGQVVMVNQGHAIDGLGTPQALLVDIIVSSIALAQEPLSIARIADLVDIKAVYIVNVLVNLHAIIQLPGDDNTPITLWHTSLRDFLTSASRSGVFYARPTHHAHIALRCIDLAISCEGLDSTETSPALPYAQRYLWDHKRYVFPSFNAIEGEDSQSSHSSPREMSLGDVRDVLYKAVLDHSKGIAHLLEITSALALLQEPVSVTQMTDLLDVEVACVLDVLKSLRAIIHDPKDPHNSPITPRHRSLCKFLLSESHSGSFFAHPTLHGRLALRCMDLALCPTAVGGTPASSYAKKHIWDHMREILAHSNSDGDHKQSILSSILGRARS